MLLLQNANNKEVGMLGMQDTCHDMHGTQTSMSPFLNALCQILEHSTTKTTHKAVHHTLCNDTIQAGTRTAIYSQTDTNGALCARECQCMRTKKGKGMRERIGRS